MAAPKSHLRWINASLGNDLRLITVDEVCYFRSDAKYTRVVTAAQESLIRKSIRELASELNPELIAGINCQDGRLTCRGVAEAHNMKWSEPKL